MLLGKKTLWAAILIVALLSVLAPFLSRHMQHMFVMIFMYAFLSCAWNILSGYAGQFSLGHATFFGIGAYTSTLFFAKLGLTPWAGMFLGGALSVAVAMVMGFLCFRYGLQGVFFGLATLAFAEMLRIISLNVEWLGGAAGLLVPIDHQSPVLNMQFSGKLPYFYLILGMLLTILVVTLMIENSKLGYYLKAIREDEEAAGSLGVDPFKYKMYALGISAFFTALGGSFYAQYFFYIDPRIAFGLDTSIEMVIRSIFGGLGTVLGPVLGSAVLQPLSEVIRDMVAGVSGMHLMIYGAILVLVIIYAPHGVMGFLSAKLFNRPGRREPAGQSESVG